MTVIITDVAPKYVHYN